MLLLLTQQMAMCVFCQNEVFAATHTVQHFCMVEWWQLPKSETILHLSANKTFIQKSFCSLFKTSGKKSMHFVGPQLFFFRALLKKWHTHFCKNHFETCRMVCAMLLKRKRKLHIVQKSVFGISLDTTEALVLWCWKEFLSKQCHEMMWCKHFHLQMCQLRVFWQRFLKDKEESSAFIWKWLKNVFAVCHGVCINFALDL